jgi:hypothetical protein
VPADREHVGPGSQARDVAKQEESDDMRRATHSSAVGPTRLWFCRQNAERGRTTGWSIALTRFLGVEISLVRLAQLGLSWLMFVRGKYHTTSRNKMRLDHRNMLLWSK